MGPESERPDLASAEEMYADFMARRERGEAVEWDSFLSSHPELSEQLRVLGEKTAPSDTAESQLAATYIVETDVTESSRTQSRDDEQILLVTYTDRYLQDDQLGQGGMGVVNKVWDKNLKRSLAMKVIRQRDAEPKTNLSTISRDETRFLEEAQTAARLEHPGVAPVHEIGRDADGQLYFTMRLVAGENLDVIFRKVWDREQNWTQTRALQVLIRVCETIAFAHSRGVIHRDLKNENVMVGQFGETYVMDWGLAKHLHSKQPDDPSETGFEGHSGSHYSHIETQAGTIVGTPRFMPPEQAAGDVENLDERSDVYAIGAMLYSLLALRVPYAEVKATTSMDLINAVLAGPPVEISKCNPKVPAELVAICEKAMARRQEDRYQTASELGEDLQAYLDNRVVRAHQTGALAEAKKWFARNRLFAAASLAAVLLGVAGLIAVVGVQSVANDRLTEANENILRESSAKTQALTEKEEALIKEQTARREADENLKRSQSLYLATRASAVLDENPGLSLVLAVEAAEQFPSEPANNALIAALDQNRERFTLTTAQGDAFAGAAYSPDGTLIVTPSEDGTVRMWDADSGRLVKVLAGHGDTVYEAMFNVDSSRIVTASRDGNAIIWDTATGKPVAVLRGHAAVIRKAIFNSDSTKVLTASYDHTAGVWDAATGRQLQKLEGHQDLVTRAAFSRDNRLLATGAADNTIRVWDAETGKLRFPPLQHEGGISSLVFSPDDRYLLSCGGRFPGNPSSDHLARLWDTQTGELVRSLEGPQNAVYMAVYSDDGKWIVTSSQDGKARIYDASTGDLHLELDPGAPVYYLACDRAGNYVAASTSQHEVYVWRISSGSLVTVFRGHDDLIRTLEFSRDGERLLTASDDGTVREWLVSPHGATPVIERDGQTRTNLSPHASRLVTWVFRTPTLELRAFPSTDTVAEITPGGDIISVALSSDDTKVAVVTTAHRLTIYDAADGKLLQSINVPYDYFEARFDAEGTHVIAVDNKGEPVLLFRIDDGTQTGAISTGEYSMRTFSPTGHRMFAASYTQTGGQLWNLQTGKLIAKIGSDANLYASFDPPGRNLLVWLYHQQPNAPRLYNTETGELVGQVSAGTESIENAFFINDGEQVVISSDDNHLNIYDSRTLKRLHEVKTASRTPFLLVNRKLTRLLSRSDDKTLRLWNLSSGKQIALLIENAFGFGCFSPDDNQFLTWDGVSNLMILRRSLDGATLAQYPSLSPVTNAIFDPSGEWIVANCDNGTVHIWPADPLELSRWFAPRKLTPNERERLDVGDRRQWPQYRRDWTANAIHEELEALRPALDGGGTWQQRHSAAYLLRQLSQLIVEEKDADQEPARDTEQDQNAARIIDAALASGNALLTTAGRDDPRLLMAVAELHFLRNDVNSAILLAEEAARSPAFISEQAASLQSYRNAFDQSISYASIDAALSQRSSPGEDIHLELSPDNPHLSQYLEARLAQDSHQYDRAIPLFEELSRQSSESGLPSVHLAECLLAKGNAEAAEDVLATLLAGNPQADPAAWRLWSRISLAELGRTPDQLLASPVLKAQVIAAEESTDTMSSGVHRYRDDLAWLLHRWARNEVVQINCGGWDYLNSNGSFWQHDCFFESGYRYGQTWDRLVPFVGEVAGTSDDQIYQTERWWNAYGDATSRYRIPVPPGKYQITLYFAEIFTTPPDSREFNILVEGKTIRENYSPGNSGFATADRVEVTATVDDGLLEIGFVSLRLNAKISGIEIRRAQ